MANSLLVVYRCERLLMISSLLLLLPLACFVDIENAPCISSSNCPANQYCKSTDKRCHKTDFKNYSCEEGGCGENEFCYRSDMTCHLRDEVGLACKNYLDCPPGQICTKEGTCDTPPEPQCEKDGDCKKANVNTAICEESVCKITDCDTGFKDEDFDYTNGCEVVLPCDDSDGYGYYEQCTGNNVCRCDSSCVILANLYGVDYEKGACLKRCPPTDANKILNDNMLCVCTVDRMGVCQEANLFETAVLKGLARAKLIPNCDDFMKDSASFPEISFSLGGKSSSYNRGVACKKKDNEKDIIQVSLYKICSTILPCRDTISIFLPADILPGQLLNSDKAGALKASITYAIDSNNVIKVTEIWFNAISVGGSITVIKNGTDPDKILELDLNLRMLRYDVPVCGEVVKKDCSRL